MSDSVDTVTADVYGLINQAFIYFNKELFDSALPPVAITLQRKKSAYGFFRGNGFVNKEGDSHAAEIALNPDAFTLRASTETLSTLVHEMCHHWQSCYGKPSRTTYHNSEFADKMAELGLICSDTGSIGGKRVGQRMSHYILSDGLFSRACKDFLNGKSIEWGGALDSPSSPTAKPKSISKVKYTCPFCEQNAWAKPNSRLLCGDCSCDGELVEMVAD